MTFYTNFLEAICERRKVQRICYAIACISYFLEGLLGTVIVSTVPLQMQNDNNRISKPLSNETNVTTSDVFASQITFNSSYTLASTSTSLLTTSLLFAIKAIVQVIVASLSGLVIDKFMYELPLLFGVGLQLIATIFFCVYINSYWFMVCARGMLGIGSAFADPAAMGLVTELYPDKNDLVVTVSVLTAISSIGIVLGPLFGGFLDE